MDMGSLERLCRKSTESFSDAEVRSIFHQVLVGVQFMHSKNFIHRDIKPENILLKRSNPEPIVKLADLGLAKHIGTLNDRPKTTYVATRWYRSPEILLRIRSYGKPSDVWAIGVVMAEVVAKGAPLFPGTNEDDQLRRVVALRGHPRAVNWEQGSRALKSKYNLPLVGPTDLRDRLPNASAAVVQLIDDMLQMDPDARPTAADALQSSVFMPSPTLQVGYASSLDSYEYGNAYHGEVYNHANYGNGYHGEAKEEEQKYVKEYHGEPKAKQLKRDETAVYEEYGETPQGEQQKTEQEYAGKGPIDLTRQFYIPPAMQERSITYTNPQRLRSPAGSFNLAPLN